jgi:hypothetical protein
LLEWNEVNFEKSNQIVAVLFIWNLPFELTQILLRHFKRKEGVERYNHGCSNFFILFLLILLSTTLIQSNTIAIEFKSMTSDDFGQNSLFFVYYNVSLKCRILSAEQRNVEEFAGKNRPKEQNVLILNKKRLLQSA